MSVPSVGVRTMDDFNTSPVFKAQPLQGVTTVERAFPHKDRRTPGRALRTPLISIPDSTRNFFKPAIARRFIAHRALLAYGARTPFERESRFLGDQMLVPPEGQRSAWDDILDEVLSKSPPPTPFRPRHIASDNTPLDETVKNILKKAGLLKYLKVFIKNEIRAKDLKFISEGDLSKMGLPLGARKRFLVEVHGVPAMTKETSVRQSCSISLHFAKELRVKVTAAELALDTTAATVCQLEDNASGIPARSSGIPRKAPGSSRLRAPATRGARITGFREMPTPTRSLEGAGQSATAAPVEDSSPGLGRQKEIGAPGRSSRTSPAPRARSRRNNQP